jgi:AcrR family transcriptional regulator
MEKRKEEIVEVALKRFAHYGFNKTTMNEVADDLHITKANLYYYYPDKSALIKDVICHVANSVFAKEEKIINASKNGFLSTLFELLELRACYLKQYYMLHINESLEWIKGVEIADFLENLTRRDIETLKSFFMRAIERGELQLDDVDEASLSYIEITKGLSIMHNVHDIVTTYRKFWKVRSVQQS